MLVPLKVEVAVTAYLILIYPDILLIYYLIQLSYDLFGMPAILHPHDTLVPTLNEPLPQPFIPRNLFIHQPIFIQSFLTQSHHIHIKASFT